MTRRLLAFLIFAGIPVLAQPSNPPIQQTTATLTSSVATYALAPYQFCVAGGASTTAWIKVAAASGGGTPVWGYRLIVTRTY